MLCLSEQHFSEVVQGEEFLGLSLQQVCSLISSDKLTVSTEEKVRQQRGHTLNTRTCNILITADFVSVLVDENM